MPAYLIEIGFFALGAAILWISTVAPHGVTILPRRDQRAHASYPEGQGIPRLRAVEDPRVLRQPTVSVVIPTLNEEGSLPWVLENIPPWVSEIVLVDGLSTDETEAVARRLRPDVVVVHQHQRGKGAALRAGFAAATGEVIVMIDADGSTDPGEMHRFLEALTAGADFVKGSRHLAEGGSADFTHIRSTGNRAFVALANLLYGSSFTDLCYGYCAFWRRHLDALALTADGFEIETQLVLNAVKAGLQIHEVPSFELERRAGTSNLNAFRDGRRVLRTMFAERPGCDSRTVPSAARIDLVPQRVLLPNPPAWLPAGYERRAAERGPGLGGTVAPYAGPERRRSIVPDAAFVYRVMPQAIGEIAA